MGLIALMALILRPEYNTGSGACSGPVLAAVLGPVPAAVPAPVLAAVPIIARILPEIIGAI